MDGASAAATPPDRLAFRPACGVRSCEVRDASSWVYGLAPMRRLEESSTPRTAADRAVPLPPQSSPLTNF